MTSTEPHPPRQRTRPRNGLRLDRSGGANAADAAGADINSIVAQYRKHGTMPHVATLNPLYGDYSFPDDIHSMREAVQRSEDRFMELPADVRSAANNDWVEFLTKFDTPDGKQELIDAGLKIGNIPPPNNSPQTKTEKTSEIKTEEKPPEAKTDPPAKDESS